jgi:hypothetical protein
MDVSSQRLQRTLQLLASIQDPSKGVREAAEGALGQLDLSSGHGIVLTNISLTSGAPNELRQLAAVLLKQYIKRHWIEGEKNYIPPVTTDDEKRYIKERLPAGLSEPNSKVRTAVALGIATIARWDYPDDWPGLLEHLVNSIKAGQDENLGEHPVQTTRDVQYIPCHASWTTSLTGTTTLVARPVRGTTAASASRAVSLCQL